MFLIIEKNINSLFEQAKNYFSKDFIKTFDNKAYFKESIVARYIISINVGKEFNIDNFIPKVNNNGTPIFYNGIFWSISHKKDLVFIGINNKKLGLDIETKKQRDISIINQFNNDEYKLLGEKNLDNFYTLWTAKESVIKFHLSNLDALKDIKLIEVQNIKQNFGGLTFEKVFTLSYNKTNNQVFFSNKLDIFYSVCK